MYIYIYSLFLCVYLNQNNGSRLCDDANIIRKEKKKRLDKDGGLYMLAGSPAGKNGRETLRKSAISGGTFFFFFLFFFGSSCQQIYTRRVHSNNTFFFFSSRLKGGDDQTLWRIWKGGVSQAITQPSCIYIVLLCKRHSLYRWLCV